jgi:quinol monooxygenase YgiN
MHVQIVKFRLRPDASREAFLEITEQMVGWLKHREGFIAYELYEGSEYWSDRIAWKNEEFARDGQKSFLATPIAQQMIPLVDNDYSSFFGKAVVSV